MIAWVLGTPSRNASHGSASPLQERVLPLCLNREITQAVFLSSYMGSPEKQTQGGEIMDLKEVSCWILGDRSMLDWASGRDWHRVWVGG